MPRSTGAIIKSTIVLLAARCELQSELRAAHEDSAALRGSINKACKVIKMVTQLKKTALEKLSKEKLFTWQLGYEAHAL